MSRIGKKIIQIPVNTEVSLADGVFVAKGPLGELRRPIRDDFTVSITDGMLTILPKKESLETNALWGTYASHITNMVAGVTTPFQKKLFLEGIGFKAEVKGTELVLALGFSHPVIMTIPASLKVVVEKSAITISGIDKEEVGSFAAKLRDYKKPEPYKGKGLRYEGEIIKIKQGKKSA